MEDDLTGVFSLGEVSIAEIVSLSQCAMGIGPCCLKMSARALNEEEMTQISLSRCVWVTKPLGCAELGEEMETQPSALSSHSVTWGWCQWTSKIEVAMPGETGT